MNVIKKAFQRIQVPYTSNGIMHNLSDLQVLTSTLYLGCAPTSFDCVK